MKLPFPEFFKGLALTLIGSTVSVREILVNGSLLATIAGAVMTCIGGYWAWRVKRAEAHLKEYEVMRVRREMERSDSID